MQRVHLPRINSIYREAFYTIGVQFFAASNRTVSHRQKLKHYLRMYKSRAILSYLKAFYPARLFSRLFSCFWFVSLFPSSPIFCSLRADKYGLSLTTWISTSRRACTASWLCLPYTVARQDITHRCFVRERVCWWLNAPWEFWRLNHVEYA